MVVRGRRREADVAGSLRAGVCKAEDSKAENYVVAQKPPVICMESAGEFAEY